MTIGIYAGSFDPITYGHLNIIGQAASAFEQIIVAVGVNSAKKGLFTPAERVGLIEKVLSLPAGVAMAVSFEGLLTEFCRQVARERKERVVIIRGLRAVSDFESEMAIAHLNSTLCLEVPTVFFPTASREAFVSSSAAREMARYERTEEALQSYVPPLVAKALKEKLGPKPAAGSD